MRVGIDAHKMKCTTVIFGDSVTGSRVGDDVSRFDTKKHLCSYAGVVPKANNSGEYISEHNHVKHGDIILKYALTCIVRGAILANKNSSIKLFYRKILKKGVSPQKAQIAAARKMACMEGIKLKATIYGTR